jgi:hypothetical protein
VKRPHILDMDAPSYRSLCGRVDASLSRISGRAGAVFVSRAEHARKPHLSCPLCRLAVELHTEGATP